MNFSYRKLEKFLFIQRIQHIYKYFVFNSNFTNSRTDDYLILPVSQLSDDRKIADRAKAFGSSRL